MKTQIDIQFFLTYGYFPNYRPKYNPEKVDKIEVNYTSYSDLQSQFYQVFDTVIKETIESIPKDKLIVIPISGGLDSRAILAVALKHVNPNRIRTYTFGVKGSYDFEIGQQVAKKAGIHHDAIELNSLRFTQEEMLEVAKRCDFQTHLFHHPPLKKLEEIISDNYVISGYMGDVVFGSSANTVFSNPDRSQDYYLRYKKYSYKSTTLDSVDYKVYLEPIKEVSIIPHFDQLLLFERGSKLIAPHILMKGDWTYKVPLIDKRILDFMYSIPNTFRLDERLFIDTMLSYYPDLFNIRAKTTFGCHLKAPKVFLLVKRLKNKIILNLNRYLNLDITYPPYNYIDFNKEILRRPDLKLIFESNLQDLEKRAILTAIKPMEVLKRHKKTKNLYGILVLLTSLELILKAKEQ
jgi:hypothetical protein